MWFSIFKNSTGADTAITLSINEFFAAEINTSAPPKENPSKYICL